MQRKARSIKNIGLVIVDYLQLLTPTTSHKMREREVAEASRAMKQLALSLKCPVLLLSQLNRAVETTERQPQLSDLRESGAIEQDADVVIFLHAKKEDTTAATMPVRAIIAEGRSSGTGAASLMFDTPHCNFTEDERADRWAATERGLTRSRQDNGL